MSEQRVLLMAGLAWLGVRVPLPLYLPAIIVLVGVALILRGEVALLVAVCALSSSLSYRAEAAYVPAQRMTLSGTVVELVTDPEPAAFGIRAEVKLIETNQRVRLTASGMAGESLRSAVAGQRIRVDGRMTPGNGAPWLKSRHLVGSVVGDEIVFVRGVRWFRLPSEWLRSAVRGGAASFDDDAASLYLGLVIGDDRNQTLAQEARFQTAGLTHLLAVSGQNVAFALAVAGPLLVRLGRAQRLLATGVVLCVFALATRLEPSVVRATATALIAALAVLRGARTTGTRALSLAVTALLLIDPFLAVSVGFQLSVGASLGILLLTPAIQARLPGPRWLVEPAAITIGAQLGVSPVLISVFGPMSLVTLPANLLAGWAAGAVMMLGLSVGVVAGPLPDGIGNILQLPTWLLVRWIDGVAALCARAPAPVLDGSSVVVCIALGLAALLLRSWRTAAGTCGTALVVLLAASIPGQPTGPVVLEGGGRWFPATDTTASVLIVDVGADSRLVAAIVAARITEVDIVVLARGGRSTGRLVANVVEVAPASIVLAPPLHQIVGATRVVDPLEIEIGSGTIALAPDDEHLVIAGPD